MHPKMMAALAREVERERQDERQRLQMRSQVLADRSHYSNDGSPAASWFARTLVAGVGVRPRFS